MNKQGFYLSPDGLHIIQICGEVQMNGVPAYKIFHENFLPDRGSYIAIRNFEIFFSAWEKLDEGN